MKFGENPRIARENAGMTQKGLAFATGLHYGTIQNNESVTRRPQNYEVIVSEISSLLPVVHFTKKPKKGEWPLLTELIGM